MNTQEPVKFMFIIAREIKRSFESPVILLTLKDYANCIFNTLITMRTAMLENAQPEEVAEIVNSFHLEWLQAVQDIENFKKRAKNTPRESILKTLDYTIECMKSRHKYFQRFVEESQKTMIQENKNMMQADIQIIGDMYEVIKYALVEKKEYLLYQADKGDFYVIIMNEVEELMNWLDIIYDHLAIQFSKVLHLKLPLLPGDLDKTLQEIIDELDNCLKPGSQEADKEFAYKPKTLGSADRLHGMEICKVIEKIKKLEDRINRLKIEDSSAVMALEHKTMYLEERLLSLHNLKLSLNSLKIPRCVIRRDGTVDEDELHIFNHLLPQPERHRLVDHLVNLWNTAIITGKDLNHKSIISILSSADLKEVFADEMGRFSVDKYGRKIYTFDNDEQLYQVNDQNELVPVKDDEKHVYFFDECGRYFLNNIRERVYKAHDNASDYVLHKEGLMHKVREVENGVEHLYDNLGRYYINAEGVRIYKDKESNEEYQNDGHGNLVRIRDNISTYNTCHPGPMVTHESIYLRETVGAALKICITEAVAIQPADPVRYLADRLEQYHLSIYTKQNRLKEHEQMMAERKHTMAEGPQSASLYETETQPEESISVTDLNFTQYETSHF
ncbi:Uncharacterized protein OBRU01_09762 [Operophtera brumata]|uniref:Uncharacterized protein n=1 Tax=Operophtera brumata TaxID=104452 RepID=A0A0L7LEN2_OPEBR|nr:Uncharacterized protein OBRU01_09762 [Operophtera brumata]